MPPMMMHQNRCVCDAADDDVSEFVCEAADDDVSILDLYVMRPTIMYQNRFMCAYGRR